MSIYQPSDARQMSVVAQEESPLEESKGHSPNDQSKPTSPLHRVLPIFNSPAPSADPSNSPSESPSEHPSSAPSTAPTAFPSASPSSSPDDTLSLAQCGCPDTCNLWSLRDKPSGQFICEERINFLQQKYKDPRLVACRAAAEEGHCSNSCHPDKCTPFTPISEKKDKGDADDAGKILDDGDGALVDVTGEKQSTSSTKAVQVDTTTDSADDGSDNGWQQYNANRTIAFVHIGKAGGMTVRMATSLACRVGINKTEEQVASCIDNHLHQNATLARQVKYYFHMWAYKEKELADATSYLVVLRNPVDRAISSYRHSHPANCHGNLPAGNKPHGCYLKSRSQKPGNEIYRFYTQCFPSAGMESFAQNVLSPYPPTFNNTSMTKRAIHGCRRLAHRMLRGFGPGNPSPHYLYNYAWYMDRTVRLHPTKEVFGIRTENEWEDLQALDISVGGIGEFQRRGGKSSVSHGSEAYLPSPLTTKAYHKLCCVLEQEIANYWELLGRVQNLNKTAKQNSMDKVREKCGIDPSMSLKEWRTECQAKIDHDKAVWK